MDAVTSLGGALDTVLAETEGTGTATDAEPSPSGSGGTGSSPSHRSRSTGPSMPGTRPSQLYCQTAACDHGAGTGKQESSVG